MGTGGAIGWAAAGAGALLLAAAAPPPASRLPTRAELKACPAFADLDFAKLRAAARPTDPAWREAMDKRHTATRGPYGNAVAPADARVTLRIWAGPGETQESPTETSSLVWQGADGAWQVDRVDRAIARPVAPKPPLPPGPDGRQRPYVGWTDDEYQRLMRDRIAGPLDPAQARAIEVALADPCLALQPDAMPLDPPVRRGRPPRAPCYGIIGGTVEIAWADGRRRDVTELCGGFYAKPLIDAVLYARTAAGGRG